MFTPANEPTHTPARPPRCLSRLGLPTTFHGGFHQLEGEALDIRHVLEEHVSGPCLGIAHRPWLLSHASGVEEASFFEALRRNPLSFMALTVAEVRSDRKEKIWTAAISSGLSVRMWPHKKEGLLWWGSAKSESPMPDMKYRQAAMLEEFKSELRYTYAAIQPKRQVAREHLLISLYVGDEEQSKGFPDSNASKASRRLNTPAWKLQKTWKNKARDAGGILTESKYPWSAVVVIEDQRPAHSSAVWTNNPLKGPPRSLCHVATSEVHFPSSATFEDIIGGKAYVALVIRVRDCAQRGKPLPGGYPANSEDTLGGLGVSALSGLIAANTNSRYPVISVAVALNSTTNFFEAPPFAFIPIPEKKSGHRGHRQLRANAQGNHTLETTTPKRRRGLREKDGSKKSKSASVSSKTEAKSAGLPTLSKGGWKKDDGCKYVSWKKTIVCPITYGSALEELKEATKDLKFQGHFPPGQLVASQGSKRWMSLLKDEYQAIASGDFVAFGILTSARTAVTRLPLLELWWLPGAVGCVSVDSHLDAKSAKNYLSRLLPQGLEVCEVPGRFKAKPWMEVGQRNRGLHRGALMHLVILQRFPTKKWWVNIMLQLCPAMLRACAQVTRPVSCLCLVGTWWEMTIRCLTP